MSHKLIIKNEFPKINCLRFEKSGESVPDLNGIHLWQINITSLKPHLNFYEKILSKDELEKSLKFKFEADRLRACFSRACLRILCGAYLLKSPGDLNFEYNPKGKPFLGSRDLSFNLSHSNELILIGFSKRESIGVDLEYNFKTENYMAIGEKYFHPKESAVLKTLPKEMRKGGFFKYWTAKEAYVKALGDGIGKKIQSFYIKESLAENKFLEISGPLENGNPKGFVYLFSPQKNYFAAVCIT
ncbi:MAG: 4'-phosphopantetheinyl transferase superfamily protein [Desulforegulaceae bacterium]|nr:4'-phosphopantetheinyl transferase superfamily protein [Desulforegulaceae bacterium]